MPAAGPAAGALSLSSLPDHSAHRLDRRKIDADSHPLRLPREHRQLVDRLNADGGRGYRPIDVAWRDAGTDGSRAVDVILARKRD